MSQLPAIVTRLSIVPLQQSSLFKPDTICIFLYPASTWDLWMRHLLIFPHSPFMLNRRVPHHVISFSPCIGNTTLCRHCMLTSPIIRMHVCIFTYSGRLLVFQNRRHHFVFSSHFVPPNPLFPPPASGLSKVPQSQYELRTAYHRCNGWVFVIGGVWLLSQL